MLIKKKLVIFVILFNFSALFLIYFVFKFIISSAYSNIELEDAVKNVERVMNALETRISYIESFNRDYAQWDDSYEFVTDPISDYETSNLTIDIFKTFKINFLVFVNTQGKIVFSKAADYNTNTLMDLPVGLANYIFQAAPLTNHTSVQSTIKGVLNLEATNVIISSLPITHSDGSGPINGTLIFGSYIDQNEIESLKASTKFDVSIYSYKKLKPDLTGTLGVYEGQKDSYIEATNSDNFTSYRLLRDIFGKPALIVEVLLPRQLGKEGIRTFEILMLFIVVTGASFSLIGILFLNKTILNRINSLSDQVNKIKNTKSKVKLAGKDEIAELANNINNMIDEIESTSSELKSVNDLLVNKTMDLEKINKLLIGREVKMTELKAKIRELEEKAPTNAVN